MYIVAMSFPGSGLETTYRNNLREVAKMLQTNHQDKYMVRAFSLSLQRLKFQDFFTTFRHILSALILENCGSIKELFFM